MTSDAATAALQEIRDLNPYQLASMAECASPDSVDSAGAQLLASVAYGVVERVEWLLDNGSDTLADAIQEMADGSGAHEIADGAPDVYTGRRWREFADLGAWQEDVDEFGPIEDMTQAAGAALYVIADRLVSELLGELADVDEDDETTEDDQS